MLTAPSEAADHPLAWLAGVRQRLRAAVAEHGVLLVRGLRLSERQVAVEAGQQLIAEPCAELEKVAARTVHTAGVYSSSAWPADEPKGMHQEMSYALEVPSLLVLCCVQVPAAGGATGVADSQQVLADLPSGLVMRFERLGWQLLRHYNPLVGVAWQTAFGGDDPAPVEEYFRQQGIEFRWDGRGGLRTRQHRPAVMEHPATGRRCWFNQIASLSEWSLHPAVRAYLATVFGDGGLPFTTRHGDGGAIDATTVGLINETYDRHTRWVQWQQGDLLLVDNIRMAHSREAYEGTREIIVVMGDPVRR